MENDKWTYDKLLSNIQDKFVVITGDRGSGKTITMLKLAEDLATRLNIPFSIEKNLYIGSRTLQLQNTKMKVCYNLWDLSLEEMKLLDYYIRITYIDRDKKQLFLLVEGKDSQSNGIGADSDISLMAYLKLAELQISFPSLSLLEDYDKLKLVYMADPHSFLPNLSYSERKTELDHSIMSPKMISLNLQVEFVNKLIKMRDKRKKNDEALTLLLKTRVLITTEFNELATVVYDKLEGEKD